MSTTEYRESRYQLLSDTLIMAGRSMRHALREVDALLTGFLMPIMLVLLMTFVFGGAMQVGGAYIDYVVPGVILLTAGHGASMTAMSVTRDMTEGIVDRFRTMAVTPGAVIIGHVAASLVRNLVTTALVVGTALLIGFRPSAGMIEWFAVVGVASLYIVAVSWLAALIGQLSRSVEGASTFGFFMLFLPYLSGSFVPVGTLPRWLKPIAEHQPMTPISETIRGLLFGSRTDEYWLASVVWCVAITALSAIASTLLWSRSRQ